jgi:HAD superfamily hydrolase (TIGR01549 family)
MIKAIIFDFFGVLALRNAGSFRQTYFPNDSAKISRNKKAQEDLARGLISYDNYINELAEIGGVDRETVVKYTGEFQSNIELLEYISNQLKPGYKLGIISNAGADWVLRILGPTNVDLFDDIVLSYKVGMIKPEPEIYELAAKNLSVKPNECIFVDDIMSYCQGAQKVGMKFVWYQNFGQMRADLEKILPSGPNN